jgi:hypothetical protein
VSRLYNVDSSALISIIIIIIVCYKSPAVGKRLNKGNEFNYYYYYNLSGFYQ